jgi:hypothetical protein
MADELANLKRKRATLSSNVTRFTTTINGFSDTTTLDDVEHYRDRLQETLDRLTTLDDSIQNLIEDEEYAMDVDTCEEYIERSKRAVQKVSRAIETKISNSLRNVTVTPPGLNTVTSPSLATPTVKLPTIKLDPVTGNIEQWTRFWEQFDSSIDKNPSVSQINKHVFLRGYLEG